MDYVGVLTIVVGLVIVGLLSRKLEGSTLTSIMLVTAFGFVVGPANLDLVPVEISHRGLHLLAEITLILILFTDAANTDLGQLRRDHNLPVRLLTIGMPLSIVIGGVVALLCFGMLSPFEALLLAAILAPTDAALGQAVVTDVRVPVRVRMTLNVESGLNDGIALPLVVILASCASAMNVSDNAVDWLEFGAKQVVLGPLAGVGVGYLGARLVKLCFARQWMTESAEGIVGLGVALTSFAAAELVHGNGFIAAFACGLTFGNTLQRKCRFLYEFAETEGQILVLLTFLAFGSAMVPEGLAGIDLRVVLFAALMLTVARMVPVYIALIGSGTRPLTRLFLGWFGPRGLASVLFVLLILEDADIGHRDEVFTAAMVTVVLSVFLHGATAGPAARRYGAVTQGMGKCEENVPVAEQPFSPAKATGG